MPKTLLAVDDSVTMRKVIEMTFAGEDVRVVAVSTAQEALGQCRRESPDIVLADVALEGYSGYDLCRAIKDEFTRIPVVLLASKQNPYDPARAQAAGADEHIDKPYDTTKAIELVKRVLTQGQSVAPRPIAAAPIAAAPEAARTAMFAQPAVPTPPPLPPVAAPPPQRTHPTMQGMPASQPPPPPLAASASATAGASEDAHPALTRHQTPALRQQHTVRLTSDAPPARSVSPAPASGNGAGALPPEYEGRLRDVGLTPAQVDAVLALSREVVERVVWEVVPVLAETMIREEITRLTRE